MYTEYVSLSDSSEWRSQNKFLYLFYFNALISSMAQATILPGLWSLVTAYGEALMVMGYMVFTYIVGEISGSILFGHMHDCFSSKRSLIVSCLMGLIGAGLFTGVTYLKIDSNDTVLWIALCARFLHGFWAGGHSTISQAYVSDVIPEAFKLKALSDIGLLNIIGNAFGPFIGFVLVFYEKELGYHVYTTSGALLTVSILLMILGLIIFFREAKQQKSNRREIIPSSQEEFQINFGVFILIFIWSSHFLAFSAIETITSPLFTTGSVDRNLDQESSIPSYNWKLDRIYSLYGFMGIFYLIGYAIVHTLGNHVSPRVFLSLSLLFSVGGYTSLCFIHDSLFDDLLAFLGYCLISVSFPVIKQYVLVLYSYNDDKMYSTGYMAGIFSISGLGRMLGPWVGAHMVFYKFMGTHMLFVILAGIYLICFLLVCCYWTRFNRVKKY